MMYISCIYPPSLTKKITCLTKEWRLTLVVVTSFAEKLNLDPLHREVSCPFTQLILLLVII